MTGKAGIPAAPHAVVYVIAAAPDWMPDFMARDWIYAQNAIWVLNHPGATAEHIAFAASVLAGYIIGYGGVLAGFAMLGYAGAQAKINTIGLACVGNPICAVAIGLGDAGANAASSDGDCTNEVNFIVDEKGNEYPLQPGSTGPFPKINGLGVRWENGEFGFRLMPPNAYTPWDYENYYKILQNGGFQAISPFTGLPIPKSDILWHIPLYGTWVP